jgi:serine/threonine protein kinase
MFRAGLLTRFQAAQLLRGKWQGFSIGKYRVLDLLGSGSRGNVYLCEHTLLWRRVAVKVPFTELRGNLAVRESLRREVRADEALDHPNVVRIYDVEQVGEQILLVMEYVDGSTLRSIVTTHGPLDVFRAAHYIRQAAQGLEHIHKAGMAHHNLTPASLLLSRTGVVKLFNLGHVRFLGDQNNVPTWPELALGGTTVIVRRQAQRDLATVGRISVRPTADGLGNAAYGGLAADRSADIHDLGMTFLQLLTAWVPLQDGTGQQTHLVRSLRALRPEVPEELAVVIGQMTSGDPAERFSSAAEVADALNPWTDAPIPPPPEAEMPRLSPALLLPVKPIPAH